MSSIRVSSEEKMTLVDDDDIENDGDSDFKTITILEHECTGSNIELHWTAVKTFWLLVGGGQDGSVNNNIEDDKGIYYDGNINENGVYLVIKLV